MATRLILARHWPFIVLLVLTATCNLGSTQPQGPQPWWPTQPVPLPFVHPLFASDAVLQRDIAVPVWGWSTPGDRVRITVDGKPSGEAAVAAADGRWQTRIGPFAAGGPHSIQVEGSTRTAKLENVLFGDVWLCSGQSNMNWPVRLATDGEAEAKRADYPAIRSFTVGFYPALTPQLLPQPAKWEVCTPATARNFTGVGYFFARHIHEARKVPVGIIHASAGATAAEAWTSAAGLRRHMPFDFRERLADVDKTVAAAGPNFEYFAAVEKWAAAADPASAKKRYTSDPNLDTADWADIAVPKPWQEAGLKDFDGLVWFRRTIELPESWKGKELRLALSVVRDTDAVWFNGTLIGATQTPGTSRVYLVDAKLVHPGKNLLVAAVMNKTGPGGFCSAPGQMFLQRVDEPASKPLSLAGTWKAKAAVRAADLPAPPSPLVGNYKTITSLDNGMIAPLVPFAIKGAVWYQGESNWPFGPLYRRLLPTLIADWRERFGVGDFPFLIVSLANYNPLQTKPVEPGWAELREAQWRTARKVPNTGLAVTIDIGDANDIHPRNKQEVGRRLGLVARRLAYGEKDVVASGPEFDEMMIEKAAIRLYFKHVGGGLTLSAGAGKLTGFAIAGADKQFVWADAVIDGSTVIVSSPAIPEPKHVRYGWASNPVVNLFNKDGLPAIPFRTDE